MYSQYIQFVVNVTIYICLCSEFSSLDFVDDSKGVAMKAVGVVISYYSYDVKKIS